MFVAIAALSLALAPGFADARAGFGNALSSDQDFSRRHYFSRFDVKQASRVEHDRTRRRLRQSRHASDQYQTQPRP